MFAIFCVEQVMKGDDIGQGAKKLGERNSLWNYMKKRNTPSVNSDKEFFRTFSCSEVCIQFATLVKIAPGNFQQIEYKTNASPFFFALLFVKMLNKHNLQRFFKCYKYFLTFGRLFSFSLCVCQFRKIAKRTGILFSNRFLRRNMRNCNWRASLQRLSKSTC